MLLRNAGPADQQFLFELYADTRADEMERTGWAAHQIEEFMRLQFDAQRADYQRRFPNADHSIVTVDGVAVGRIWVDRGPIEVRLLDLAISSDRRDRGTGTQLITKLQHEARLARLPLRHSVVKENLDALRLYLRLDFAIVGDHPTHHLMEWIDPLRQPTDANTAS